ncbi:hypothetical protein B0T21DRAFT_47439 [Apiosordaria backusii]|uniref:Uncharacterized protein n=1 Tax=Apiosordaria backusii TaxID=314023 RepID=A0AA40AXQ4_9PEZI|nr:hypothetical protein B0T21DRAFT_47439 [Apiosordaria backusii]
MFWSFDWQNLASEHWLFVFDASPLLLMLFILLFSGLGLTFSCGISLGAGIGLFSAELLLRGRRAEHGEHWRIRIDIFGRHHSFCFVHWRIAVAGLSACGEISRRQPDWHNIFTQQNWGCEGKRRALFIITMPKSLAGRKSPNNADPAATWTPQSRRHHLYQQFFFFLCLQHLHSPTFYQHVLGLFPVILFSHHRICSIPRRGNSHNYGKGWRSFLSESLVIRRWSYDLIPILRGLLLGRSEKRSSFFYDLIKKHRFSPSPTRGKP